MFLVCLFWFFKVRWFICDPQQLLFLTDSEIEALSENNLCILTICSWYFSMASFILLARSIFFCLFLIYLSELFFRAGHLYLLCRTWGIIKPKLESFIPHMLIIFKCFMTTNWQKSSSLEKLKSLQVLLAPLGSNLRCHRSNRQSNNILLSSLNNSQVGNT